MTKSEAIRYARICGETDGPETYEEASAFFEAIFGRAPNHADGDQHELWSHACAAAKLDAAEMPETITVPVTRDHIQRCRPGDPRCCAAALAIKELLGEPEVEVEEADAVSIGGFWYAGDDSLQSLVRRFDNLADGRNFDAPLGPVGPCTFELKFWVQAAGRADR